MICQGVGPDDSCDKEASNLAVWRLGDAKLWPTNRAYLCGECTLALRSAAKMLEVEVQIEPIASDAALRSTVRK